MIESIAGFLFWFVFSILFSWTGEVLLFCVTLGKRKPRWDLYTKESPARFVIFSELSLWIGVAFWIAVALLVL